MSRSTSMAPLALLACFCAEAAGQSPLPATPFRNTVHADPNYVADESIHYTNEDTDPPNPFFYEFQLGSEKVSVCRPEEIILADVIPLPLPLPLMPGVTPNPEVTSAQVANASGHAAKNACYADDEGNPNTLEDRVTRYWYRIHGFDLSVTFDPGRIGQVEPTTVLITSPATAAEGDYHVAPQTTADMETITLGWRAVEMGGVSIYVREAFGGQNVLFGDLVGYLIAAHYARHEFKYQAENGVWYPPCVVLHGGSWSGGTAMTAALLRPDLFDGYVGSAAPADSTEFMAYINYDMVLHPFTTGRIQGLGDGGGIPVLASSAENTSIPSLARMMSLRHHLQLLPDRFNGDELQCGVQIEPWDHGTLASCTYSTMDSLSRRYFHFVSGNDFHTDSNGSSWQELACDEDVRIKVFPNAGHGPAVNEGYGWFALSAIMNTHLLSRDDPPDKPTDPFATDPVGNLGESTLYQTALHSVPHEQPAPGGLALQFPAIESGESAAPYAGRHGAVSYQAGHFFVGGGDGRVRVYGLIDLGNGEFDLDRIGQSPSQGFGVTGLDVADLGGQVYRVTVASFMGRLRQYTATVTPGNVSWVLDSEQGGNADLDYTGREPRLVRTTFIGLDALFLYADPRQLWEAGSARNGPVTIFEPTDPAYHVKLDTSPLSVVADVGGAVLLGTYKGYLGKLHPTDPIPQLQQFKFSEITNYLAITPRQVIGRSRAGQNYYVVGGDDGASDLALLPEDFGDADALHYAGQTPSGRGPILAAHPTNPAKFYAARASNVKRYKVTTGATIVEETGYGFSTSDPADIQSLTPFLWLGQPMMLVTDAKGGLNLYAIPVSSAPTRSYSNTELPTSGLPLEITRTNFQGIDVDEEEGVFAVHEHTGRVFRLDASLQFQEEISSYVASGPVPPGALGPDEYVKDVIVTEPGGATPYHVYPIVHRGKRLRTLDPSSASTAYEDYYATYGPVPSPDPTYGLDLEVWDMSVPDPSGPVWTSRGTDPCHTASSTHVGGQDDLNNAKSIAFVREPQTDQVYLVSANKNGHVVVYSGSDPTTLCYCADENLGGRLCYALDLRWDAVEGKLILYRGCMIQGEQGGALEAFSFDPVAKTFASVWSGSLPELDDQGPTGVRYIGEATADQGRLVVGDRNGHLYVFDAAALGSLPTLLARTAALDGAVGVDGFYYLSDRSLVFSSASSTYRVTLVDGP